MVGRQKVITVAKDNPVSVRRGYSGISRSLYLPMWLHNIAACGITRRHYLRCVVGRSIVNHDHFLERTVLGEDRVERLSNES